MAKIIALVTTVGSIMVLVCIYFLLGAFSNTLSFTCVTKGAQIFSSTTKDGKYTKVWCLKNGVVVP